MGDPSWVVIRGGHLYEKMVKNTCSKPSRRVRVNGFWTKRTQCFWPV